MTIGHVMVGSVLVILIKMVFGKELYMQEGVYSYIYCGDNWTYNEEIFAYAQSSGDWSCTPNTDYTNYANRQININGPITVYETCGSCETCTSNGETFGCTDPAANNYNQNATIEMVHVHIRQQL